EESKKRKLYTPLKEINVVYNDVYKEEYAIKGYSLDMELDANEIDENNYLELCAIADKQYDFFILQKHLSGYCIVDWRIIFAALFEYVKPHIANGTNNKKLLEFHDNYEMKSASELYTRLGLEP